MNVHPPATGQPSSDTPSPALIVSTLETKFPNLGNRAQEALRLYLAGEVQPLSRSQTLHDDRWKVCGYTVSISGKYCTCGESDSAPRHNGGPLCAHRIAVMLQQRLGAPVGQSLFGPASNASGRLSSIFANANTEQVAEVRLRVKVSLTWSRATEQANACEGYLLVGEGNVWQPLEVSTERAAITGAPTAFDFTLSDLAQALDAHGWQYVSKNRSTGGGAAPRLGLDGWINEIWYFAPAPERASRFSPVIRTRIGAVTA